MVIELMTCALLLGGSVRTPNVQPNPFDYEISAGVEIGDNLLKAWTWHERQDGIMWTGVDARATFGNDAVESVFFFQNRQAQGILRGGTKLKTIFAKYGRIGGGLIIDHNVPVLTGHIGAQSKAVRAGIDLYAEGVESGSIDIQKALRASKWLEVVPMAKYQRDRAGNEFYQAKINLKFSKGK